jgi:hypothetical protein
MAESPDVPDGDEEAPLLQVEESTPADIAREFADLGAQLAALSNLLFNEGRERGNRMIFEHGDPDEHDLEEMDRAAKDDFRRALTALRSFRRDYYHWERVVAEYALTKMGYTQRDAAKALGVGLSTINRWAQHPIKIDDYR